MPPPSEAAKRYQIIDACLRNPLYNYVSTDKLLYEIAGKLKKKISKETLQKDIAQMKKLEADGGFSAPIKSSRSGNGYYYSDKSFVFRSKGLNEDELQAIDLAIDFLKQYKGASVHSAFNQAIDKLLSSINIEKSKNEAPTILPEENNYIKGMEYFEILLQAIKQKKPVSFCYYSFPQQDFYSVMVHPYLLKESGKRWYLVAYPGIKDKIIGPTDLRYYGLDRMYNPVLLNKPFIDNHQNGLFKVFEESVGFFPADTNKGKAEEVILKVSQTMAPYLETLPLHKSQQTIEREVTGAIIIKLQVVPTLELISAILFQGKEMEIIQPDWLRTKIKEDLKASINKYK